MGPTRMGLPYLARQRRFPDMSRTQNGDDGKGAKPFQEGVDVLLPPCYRQTSYQENSVLTAESSW